MNVTEHLLICLSEEAGEIVQACAKALRFGLTDGYPGTDRTNATDIAIECSDLITVLDMLHARGDVPIFFDSDRYEAKKAKVLKYIDYATRVGTLSNSADHAARKDNHG